MARRSLVLAVLAALGLSTLALAQSGGAPQTTQASGHAFTFESDATGTTLRWASNPNFTGNFVLRAKGFHETLTSEGLLIETDGPSEPLEMKGVVSSTHWDHFQLRFKNDGTFLSMDGTNDKK
jgi:hypothetical protein